MFWKLRLPVALVLACVGGLCQQPPLPSPQGVYRVGNGVTPPAVISKTDPEYSEEARIAKMSGTVLVSVVVGEDGKARDVRAVRSPGLGLDEKAIEAVGRWQFKPGMKEGMPVPVAASIEINFRLARAHGDSPWTLSRAAFNALDGTTKPVLTRAPYPSADTTTGANGSVAISFDVDRNGTTANLHIEKSSSSALESEVIRIVRGWQFRPGVKDGQPVSVPCTLEFVEGNVQ
jgi:TonB family protein